MIADRLHKRHESGVILSTSTSDVVYGERDGRPLLATIYGEHRGEHESCVVMCPPYPPMGGSRRDERLVMIARGLNEIGISALCADYGPYSGGQSEIRDIVEAIDYADRRRFGRIALLGYSFGALVACNAADISNDELKCVVLVSLLHSIDSLSAVLDRDINRLFVHGSHDSIAPYRDFERLYESAAGAKQHLTLETDHFYSGRGIMQQLVDAVCDFFSGTLL